MGTLKTKGLNQPVYVLLKKKLKSDNTHSSPVSNNRFESHQTYYHLKNKKFAFHQQVNYRPKSEKKLTGIKITREANDKS